MPREAISLANSLSKILNENDFDDNHIKLEDSKFESSANKILEVLLKNG